MSFREWYFINECDNISSQDLSNLNEDAISSVLTNIFKTIGEIITSKDFKQIINLFDEYKGKNFNEIDQAKFELQLTDLFDSIFDKTLGKKIDKMFEANSNIKKSIRNWVKTLINGVKLLGFDKVSRLLQKIKIRKS